MDFKQIREKCFDECRCYKNQYKGGIVEYICLQDHSPCVFQCLKDISYEKKKEPHFSLDSNEYKIE